MTDTEPRLIKAVENFIFTWSFEKRDRWKPVQNDPVLRQNIQQLFILTKELEKVSGDQLPEPLDMRWKRAVFRLLYPLSQSCSGYEAIKNTDMMTNEDFEQYWNEFNAIGMWQHHSAEFSFLADVTKMYNGVREYEHEHNSRR